MHPIAVLDFRIDFGEGIRLEDQGAIAIRAHGVRGNRHVPDAIAEVAIEALGRGLSVSFRLERNVLLIGVERHGAHEL